MAKDYKVKYDAAPIEHQINKEQSQFFEEIIGGLPEHWGKVAAARWHELARVSLRDANLYLLDIKDAVEGALEVGSSDADLILLAVELVNQVRKLKAEQLNNQKNLHDKLLALCEKYGVRYPFEHSRAQAYARLSDSAFWLRGLRAALNKKAEGAAIGAGLVHKKAGCYCSDDALQRRLSQRARNIKTLEHINMMNVDTGEVMKLSEIAAANSQDARRAELITRVKGFEELAKKYKHQAEFITLTCPSRMHAVLKGGVANPKYDGTKPDIAQNWLVQAWARTRAIFAKKNIKVYGLRIAEPHHDATPHWHLILFYRNDKNVKHAMRKVFRDKYILDDDKFNLMNKQEKADRIKNAVKFVSIDPRKGSAAGYVLKYVLKNIGGVENENNGEDEQTDASLYPRVEAWAACWRIRQFQQIGGHYVSVWRELRRVDECKLEGKRPNFVKLWQAAQKQGDKQADFKLYIECMGGLDLKPREGLFLVDYDLIMGEGKYGETVLKKVLGVGERFGREVLATNRAEWVLYD
jgi:hypothetical protein